MTKTRYWILSGLWALGVALVFFVCVPGLSRIFNVEAEHILAYTFTLVGLSVFHFGLLRPHWFAKEIVPSGQAPQLSALNKVTKKTPGGSAFADVLKDLLGDQSYFWNLFPFALFFTFGGVAYLSYPSPTSLLVALIFAAWVRMIYKFV